MQGYKLRESEQKIVKKLQTFPVVAILGPRQCGKSTMAKHILAKQKSLYLDLEKSSDIAKISEAELFFDINKNTLICLDEIQRLPELFTELRPAVDSSQKKGQFLLLGSASPDLLRQASETLAGRIAYVELSPFTLSEVNDKKGSQLNKLWLRGGFPLSYRASSNQNSFEWREQFIRTFLERDLAQYQLRVPTANIQRFWRMIAHLHGQLLNISKFSSSLVLDQKTIRRYVDILKHTFMIRLIEPYEINLKKRLVKSPKIYIRDSGILHALLNIGTMNELLGHPVYGSSFEGLVIENIIASLPQRVEFYFYRTATGVEIDLILKKGKRLIAIEIKATKAPVVAKSLLIAMADLKIKETFVVCLTQQRFFLKKNIIALGLAEMVVLVKKL